MTLNIDQFHLPALMTELVQARSVLLEYIMYTPYALEWEDVHQHKPRYCVLVVSGISGDVELIELQEAEIIHQ